MVIEEGVREEIQEFYQRNDGVYYLIIFYELPSCKHLHIARILMDLSFVNPKTPEDEIKKEIYKVARKKIHPQLKIYKTILTNEKVTSQDKPKELSDLLGKL